MVHPSLTLASGFGRGKYGLVLYKNEDSMGEREKDIQKRNNILKPNRFKYNKNVILPLVSISAGAGKIISEQIIYIDCIDNF